MNLLRKKPRKQTIYNRLRERTAILTMVMKGLYIENYKITKRENKDDTPK